MMIRRVGPLSCAKIGGTLYAVMGIFLGLMFWAFATLGAFAGAASSPERPFPFPFPFSMVFGAAAVVILPVFYGCMGFVVTLVGALLYNGVAGLVGGIEFETE